jgi:hypothetical protein
MLGASRPLDIAGRGDVVREAGWSKRPLFVRDPTAGTRKASPPLSPAFRAP